MESSIMRCMLVICCLRKWLPDSSILSDTIQLAFYSKASDAIAISLSLYIMFPFSIRLLFFPPLYPSSFPNPYSAYTLPAMQFSLTFITLFYLLLPVLSTNYKMNEYTDDNCQHLNYSHERPSPFCGQIDGTTKSVYVAFGRGDTSQFWSGANCDGTFLYSSGGNCIKLNGNEHSMGFA
ncbi:hypothetical protein ABKN59_010770 [Abortiporus biennis]